jgi:DNA-directed RNA polymerase subunit RPC12/RpoP
MRLLRFRCSECGLQMILEKRPAKCFSCGSRKVVREGWKQRAKIVAGERIQEECGQE